MALKLFTIRPEPGNAATIAGVKALGLPIAGYPLFGVEPVAWSCPDAAEYDGLLLGSANALRHGGSAIEGLTGLPVYAVGKATGKAAREAGFTVAHVGQGVLQGVIDQLAAQQAPGTPRRFLRLTGVDHVPVILPEGMSVDVRVVYSCPRYPVPEEFAAALELGGLVMLHSAVAAQHFATEVDRLGIDRSQIALATYGPRITAAAGGGWAVARSASQPAEDALLALVVEMCHDHAVSGWGIRDQA